MRRTIVGRNSNHLPNLHYVSLGQDTLDSPSGKLGAVVLHLSGDHSTTLADQLRPPVQSTSTTLCLVVELVEGLDGDVLVLAADGVLLNGINLSSDNQVHGLFIVEGQVESPVLVGFAGRWLGLLRGIVEGVGVSHLDPLVVVAHNLVGKVVVDVGSLVREGGRLVDTILVSIGTLERGIGSVFVDRDHVKRSVLTLVQEDLVALSYNDDIPGVDGSRCAHQRRENAVSGEDSCLILLSQLLDNRIRGSSNIVCSTVDRSESLFTGLDSCLVVGAVVVLEETVGVNILTLVGVQVEFSESVEVDLLKQLPVSLDVDARVAVSLRLVVVLPAETPSASCRITTSSTTATAIIVAPIALLATSSTTLAELLPSSSGVLLDATALTATTSGEDCTTTVPGFYWLSADDREGGFVFGNWCGENRGAAGSIDLLIYMSKKAELVTCCFRKSHSYSKEKNICFCGLLGFFRTFPAQDRDSNRWRMGLFHGHTSVVAVVLLSTTALSLAIGGPVCHATQLVTLGERRVWHAVQGRLGRGRRAPSILSGQGRDEVG